MGVQLGCSTPKYSPKSVKKLQYGCFPYKEGAVECRRVIMEMYKKDLLLSDRLYIQIGENIKHIRKQAHMTQEMLAELMDCDQKQISKIETGKAHPSLPTYLRIANIFHVSIDCFFNGVINENSNLDHIENMVNRKFLGATEENFVNDLLHVIRGYLEEKE